MSERRPVSSYQLKIWALLILYQISHNAPGDGYPKNWVLRFLLAFLYSHTNGGDHGPFDAFWRAATRPIKEGQGSAGYERGMDMRSNANGICKAVGEEPKAIQDQFWDELTRDAYSNEGKKLVLKR